MPTRSAFGLVTARGGSKGIPGKNIAPVAGKPLIAWTIEAALSSALERVLVSTDDAEIARVAREAGAEVPFLRPAELARDDSPHILASLHAIEWLREHGGCPDYLMLLQPTSPLRTATDIDAALRLAASRAVDAVVSVCEARHHPYNTYRLQDGVLVPFMESGLSYGRRQDFPPAYATNGAIYLNRCDSLMTERNYVPPGAIPYVMPPEHSLDIDSPWDLVLADVLLRCAAGSAPGVSGARNPEGAA